LYQTHFFWSLVIKYPGEAICFPRILSQTTPLGDVAGLKRLAAARLCYAFIW